MTVGEMKEIIEKYPDDVEFKVYSYESGYRKVKLKYEPMERMFVIPSTG